MRKSFLKYTAVFLFLIGNVNAQNKDAFSSGKSLQSIFLNNSKICFIGNSITHGGMYHAFLQAFTATRFPTEKVTYLNCGIAGDTAYGMLDRLQDDVLKHKPTHAFLMTGMNDVGRALYSIEPATEEILQKRKNALSSYYKNTEKLIQLLLEHKVKPILLTPTIFDQTVVLETANNFGTNDALGLCAIHIRKMAKKYDLPVVDFYAEMNKINNKKQLKDSTYTIVGKDRVHPGTFGHFIMANKIMETLVPNSFVSKTVIDAKSKKVLNSQNNCVHLKNETSSLSFSIKNSSLPFPIKKSIEEAIGEVSFQNNLNLELLQITNLDIGNYQLFIDDVEIAKFSNEVLEKGINLSKYYSIPQMKQAIKVFDLVMEYTKIQSNLRSISFIEYKMLKKYIGPNTIEGKKEYLYAENAKAKGKSWYAWNLETINRYFENLPQEAQLWKDLEAKRAEIFSSNFPKEHTYKLLKVN